MAGILGGPLGGFISLGVGILLQFLFPQKVEGPRQENTKTTTNKYGDVIGHTHGTIRIAGAYIWLKGDKIQERKRTYRAGKGGPEVTEYSYWSTSAAVFDWTGPVAAISRVWIDKQLAYDNTTESLQAVINASSVSGFGEWDGVTFTFYLGTDDQQPNALMVADKGADSVSGFRNMVMVVMDELNHEDIGIRLPNIEVEIVHDPSYSYLSKQIIVPEYPSGFGKSVAIDWVNKIAVFYDTALSGATVNYAWAVNLVTGEMIWSKHIVYDTGYTGIDGDPYVDLKGIVWFNDRIGKADAYDIFTGARMVSFDHDHTSASINSQNWNRVVKDTLGYVYNALFRGTTVEFIEYTTISSHSISVRGTQPAGIDAGTSTRGATLSYAADDDEMTFWIITNYSLYRVRELSGSTSFNMNTAYGTGIQGTLVYVPQDNTVIIRAANGLFKINANTFDLLDSTTSYATNATNHHSEQMGVTDDGVWWFAYTSSGSTYIVKFDAVNFVVIEEFGPVSYSAGLGMGIAYIDGIKGFLSFRGSPQYWYIDFLPTITRGSIQLADVLAAECLLVGLEVDVSAVSKTMRGYAVKDESTPRGTIEDLCRVYGIDHVQVDGVYTFFERDSTIDLTISSDHVGAKLLDTGFPQSSVKETIADVMDLPNSFTFSYLAYDAQYRVGAQRIDMPLDSTDSINEQTAKTNAALTDTEGAQAADVLLRESREVPDVYEFTLPPRYARLHPGDLVTLPLEGNKTISVVINEIEDDLVLNIKAHKRTIDYSSDAIGVATPDTDGTRLGDAVVTFVPLDANMIQNLVSEDNSGFYFCTYYTGTLEPSSANVYRSTDGGDSYEGWATLTNFASVGVLLTALEDVSSPYVTHPTAYFDFKLYSGDVPASVTEEQFIEGTLLCAVETIPGGGDDSEWEIISVKTITDNGDGSYRATGLVRGYRGTENMTDDHEIGNRVVWLSTENIARVTTDTIGLANFYAPVAAGKTLDTTRAIEFVNTGAALKPYRPVLIEGSRDVFDTLNITWVRQSRYDYDWEDLTEDVPLHETTEEYEVEYYEGSTLRRTRTGLTSPADAYEITEYQTDSGDPGATVIPPMRVVVYQISQELTTNGGRGYPGEATL